MRRLLTIFSILAALTVAGSAAQEQAKKEQAKKQPPPDFSGTWVVDVEKKSDEAAGRAPGTGRHAGRRDARPADCEDRCRWRCCEGDV